MCTTPNLGAASARGFCHTLVACRTCHRQCLREVSLCGRKTSFAVRASLETLSVPISHLSHTLARLAGACARSSSASGTRLGPVHPDQASTERVMSSLLCVPRLRTRATAWAFLHEERVSKFCTVVRSDNYTTREHARPIRVPAPPRGRCLGMIQQLRRRMCDSIQVLICCYAGGEEGSRAKSANTRHREP